MPYNSKLFLLRIVTWSFNCIQRIIFGYLEPYNCVKTIPYYQIETISWNHMIISIKQEYLKP